VRQLCGTRQLAVKADESLRQQVTPPTPRLADWARMLVVFGEAVDVLDRLADPLEPADKPDVLGLDALGAGLADGLPGITCAGECRDRRNSGRQITDHSQQSVHTGHNCIMPPPVTWHSRLGRSGRLAGGSAQPRPMKGILVAMMVRNCTLASSGSDAM